MVGAVSLVARARIAVALLVLLAGWPYLHRALVERHQLDPWRFFGFAMYCYPKNDVRLGFFTPVGEELQVVPLSALPPGLESELRRFRKRRITIGSHRPDEVARRLRASLGLDELVVQVRQLHYDTGSASFRERVTDYRYWNGGPTVVSSRGLHPRT